MINIVKELHQIALKNLDAEEEEAGKALEEVKENLNHQNGLDHSMLQYFGTQEVLHTNLNKLKKAKEMKDGAIVTNADIHKVCMKYALRCLPARLYKKEIPLKALNDLRQFLRNQNTPEHQIPSRLHVIAPKDHFVLGPRPNKDPVLVFDVSGYRQEGTKFKVISTWGDDFSPTRRIRGWWAANFQWLAMLLYPILLNTYLYVNKIAAEWYWLNLAVIVVMGVAMSINSTTEIWNKQPTE